jgi:hypothetical protein
LHPGISAHPCLVRVPELDAELAYRSSLASLIQNSVKVDQKLSDTWVKSRIFLWEYVRIKDKNFGHTPMSFFRQYVAPVIVVLLFLVALLAVSARIFLPDDMAQPAPVSVLTAPEQTVKAAQAPSALSVLVNGLPDDLALSAQL